MSDGPDVPRAARPRVGEAGAATVAALIVSMLLAAIGVGTWAVTRTWLLAAQRRAAHAEAREIARSSAVAVAGWFEWSERSGLTEPPTVSEVDRSRRSIDRDGDGRGPRYSASAAPWNVRYKERGGELFRPPDSGSPDDDFVGTPDGPDVVISRVQGDEGGSAAVLDALTRAIGPQEEARVLRVAFFRRSDRAGPQAIATVEVGVERPLAGSPPIQVRVRADVVRVPWGRTDRPLLSEDDAVLLGEAAWRHGEALIQGSLTAAASVVDGWPGGLPWLAPDVPLRDDVDGDGTADDVDGDGSADLASWRALPGGVPDPWWRGRIGGAWPDRVPSPSQCEQPFPFGPRRSPPAPASKIRDRSGLFVGCPPDARVPSIHPAWRDLARLGPRGTWVVHERPGQPGLFAFPGHDDARPAADWLPRNGGVAWLVAEDRPDRTLELAGDELVGAVIVEHEDVAIRPGFGATTPAWIPGDPTDTRGAARRASRDDDRVEVTDSTSLCAAWDIGPWVAGLAPPGRRPAHPCPARTMHLDGMLAADRRVTVVGPWRQSGQLRASHLTVDGRGGAVRIDGRPATLDDASLRPGPPGAPRVVALDARRLP